jgi:hypothetical protein
MLTVSLLTPPLTVVELPTAQATAPRPVESLSPNQVLLTEVPVAQAQSAVHPEAEITLSCF